MNIFKIDYLIFCDNFQDAIDVLDSNTVIDGMSAYDRTVAYARCYLELDNIADAFTKVTELEASPIQNGVFSAPNTIYAVLSKAVSEDLYDYDSSEAINIINYINTAPANNPVRAAIAVQQIIWDYEKTVTTNSVNLDTSIVAFETITQAEKDAVQGMSLSILYNYLKTFLIILQIKKLDNIENSVSNTTIDAKITVIEAEIVSAIG